MSRFSLLEIPDEILMLILSSLLPRDLSRVCRVNAQMYQLVLPYLWRCVRVHSTNATKLAKYTADDNHHIDISALNALDIFHDDCSRIQSLLVKTPTTKSFGIATPSSPLKRRNSGVICAQDEMQVLSSNVLKNRRINNDLDQMSPVGSLHVRSQSLFDISSVQAKKTSRHGKLVKSLSWVSGTNGSIATDSHCLSRIVQVCPGLEHVDLTNGETINDLVLNTLGRSSGESIKTLNLTQCSSITDFGLRSLAMFCTGGALTVINLKGCLKVGDSGVQMISRMCPSLATLNIARCRNLTANSLVYIGTLLNLRDLDVSKCSQIGIYGIEQLWHCKRLIKVSMADLHFLTDGLVCGVARNNTHLELINLEGCIQLSGKSLSVLSGTCKRIQVLNCTLIQELVNGDLQAFCNSVGGSLTELYLGKCTQLSNEAVLSIADNCPNLTGVYLAGIRNITDEAVCRLCECCINMRVLSVPGCSITDASILSAAKHLSTTLEVAQFSFCVEVGPVAVCRLAASCKNLHIMQLVGCPNILNSFVKGYTQDCPIEVLSRFGDRYCALRRAGIIKLIHDHPQ